MTRGLGWHSSFYPPVRGQRFEIIPHHARTNDNSSAARPANAPTSLTRRTCKRHRAAEMRLGARSGLDWTTKYQATAQAE
jgi:hypothetical protein